MDIVVVGSINMDLVTNVKQIPKKGETCMGNGFSKIPGGKGANQAVAAARLGAEVEMIGRLGDDSMSDDLIQSLKSDNVGINQVIKTEKETSGTALIMVEEMGDNAIVVIPGANARLKEEDIDASIDIIASSKIIVTQLEIPISTVKYLLTKAKELDKFTILNPAPAAPLDDDIIRHTDLLTPNETELESLTGMSVSSEEEIIEAGKSLIKRGLKKLIVTLGEKGCIYMDDDSYKRFSAVEVKAVDTTAAGDSFTAALAVALCEGKNIDEVIQFATKVGALTVTKFGAQQSLPYRNEITEEEV